MQFADFACPMDKEPDPEWDYQGIFRAARAVVSVVWVTLLDEAKVKDLPAGVEIKGTTHCYHFISCGKLGFLL